MRLLLLVTALLVLPASADVAVRSVTPGDGATGVDVEAAVQIHVPVKPSTGSLSAKSVRLLTPAGEVVPAMLQTDLGGVITVSPDEPLRAETRYTVEVTAGLKAAGGQAFAPFTSSFTTGAAKPLTDADLALRFRATKLLAAQGMTRVALGPDGCLYVGTWEGRLLRHRLDGTTGQVVATEAVYGVERGRILGMAFDPGATAERLVVWLAYDLNAGLSTTPQDESGAVSRLELGGAAGAVETKYVTGLLSAAHALNQVAFGPDGRLYVSQGSMTHLGGRAAEAWEETLVSAAILVADVRSPAFGGGQLPVDVRPPYDPRKADAPVRLFATGVREAYGLCWHSSGHLFAASNMNDTTAKTPPLPGVPGFNVQPDEPLMLVKEGRYYGHPNPARGQLVLLGGNPTAGKDPWEVPNYPVGTKPDPDFDPSLLIANLVGVGGQSADGLAEYTAAGPLKGRLLACFYTTARTVHAFELSADGRRVVDSRPLRDEAGKRLKFPSPIDLAVDGRTGRIYVVDFADPRRKDSAGAGAVWMLTPAGGAK